ncbi:MAG: ParB/RepB/Spo0J family partition protein [Ignavibacteriaceae bacterium]
MSKVKPGLGRGLDALINPQRLKEADEKAPDYSKLEHDDGKNIDVLAKIPVDLVSPNPYQPRSNFDLNAMEELKKSILSNGLIQPITVRRWENNTYQLISGERRLKACKDIGYKEIPAYIIRIDSEEGMLALALIENIQREMLNPIEVGKAYKRLMDECHLTQEQIAEKVGKDRTTIANSIRLLKLPDKVQQALVKEEITAGHARALINLPYEEMQLKILKQIQSGNLSVRKVEDLVRQYLNHQSDSRTQRKTVNTTLPSELSQIRDIEDKLRNILGTKVICRKKSDGAGEIVIEFYSNVELERLIELFDIIGKNYS